MYTFDQDVLTQSEIEISIEAFKKVGFLFNEFHSEEYLNSEAGRMAMAEHLYARIGRNEKFILPWIERAFDLSGKRVLEIGCGSGPASVAFGRKVKNLFSYEISGFGERAIAAAEARATALGVTNIDFKLEAPQNISQAISNRFKNNKVDAVLFFAVIEHMTIKERLEAITNYWNILSDDGVFIIGGLPSRFSFTDYHTSGLPFYDSLPESLALAYASRGRSYLRNLIKGPEGREEALYRAGRGASFHEFELALPGINIHNHILLDGFEPEIIAFRGGYLYPEERLREEFLEGHGINRAFAKNWLDFVISKNPVRDMKNS